MLPPAIALNVTKELIKCAVDSGALTRQYELLGGRQVISTASPGLELYGEIQDWDHWTATP